ncbi:unnamed protein product [Schistosoma margrebowiei]|uniref:Uncharacterized protein n=1 Tax=Schistosoma margrebowiei TaxID=48269 RepID=A0A183LKU5_9TREM|nr:unnamed protein product [Schistosoma margrebowiei]
MISQCQVLTNTLSMKLKVFIECRRDCSTKCNHSLFVYLANENECYTCLIECMSAFTQQAEKVGIQLKDIKKSNDANLLSDSLYAPGKKSVCNTTVHLVATTIKSCNSDSIKLSAPNDHLSLSIISKDSVDSYSSSELNETQNSCETTVSNQSNNQISHVIAPDMIPSNDSLIFDEILCKYEENMLNEASHDKKLM